MTGILTPTEQSALNAVVAAAILRFAERLKNNSEIMVDPIGVIAQERDLLVNEISLPAKKPLWSEAIKGISISRAAKG